MARSLTELLQAWDAGKKIQPPRVLLQEKVMPTLFQCLVQTLLSQHMDGSWGCKGQMEETAYAILTLASLLVLPLAVFFRPEMISAIDRGREFLKKSNRHTPEHLWIEKVSYGSANLAEAYITTALYVSIDKPSLGTTVLELCSMHYKDLAEFSCLIDRKLISRDPKWLILASWIESRLCGPWLQKSLRDMWQHPALGSYHQPTAFRWILAHSRTRSAFLPEFLCDMMNVSFLTGHLTALVDIAITAQSDTLLEQLTDAVNKSFEFSRKNGYVVSKQAADGTVTNGTWDGTSAALPSHHNLVKDERHTIYTREDKGPPPSSLATDIPSTFVEFFRCHHGLSGASEHDTAVLRLEVERFLQAQISRIEEERTHIGLPKLRQHQYRPDQGSAFHVTDHDFGNSARKASAASLTGYPHMLAFATCLRACNGKDSYSTASQKYVAEDVRNCVGTVFRLEQRLNARRTNLFPVVCEPKETPREQLIELLSYERSRLGLAVSQLEKLGLAQDELETIGIIVDVAELAAATADLQC